MTAFLRNAFLAAVAMSALAGPALADQTVTCASTSTNDLWSGRCCGAGDSNCLGGGKNGHDHDRGDNGRGNNGGQAGKK